MIAIGSIVSLTQIHQFPVCLHQLCRDPNSQSNVYEHMQHYCNTSFIPLHPGQPLPDRLDPLIHDEPMANHFIS